MFSTHCPCSPVTAVVSGAIDVVFSVGLVWSYVIAIIPAAIFTAVCMKGSTNVQLYLAGILRSVRR